MLLAKRFVHFRFGNAIDVISHRLNADEANTLIEFGTFEADVGKLRLVGRGEPLAPAEEASRGANEGTETVVVQKAAGIASSFPWR